MTANELRKIALSVLILLIVLTIMYVTCRPVTRVTCTPLPTCADIPVTFSVSATVRQHAAVNASYSLPSSLMFPSPVVAGNTLIVAIRAGSQSTHNLSVSDSQGNVYTRVAYAELLQDDAALAIFITQALTNGTCTVTVSDTNIGATRYTINEVVGLAPPARPATWMEGAGFLAQTTSPALAGEFLFTLVSAKVDAVFVPGVGGTELDQLGKLFTLHGAPNATLNPSGTWATMAVAFPPSGGPSLPPCATPTPMFQWDKATAGEPLNVIKGYAVYVNPSGGSPNLATVKIDCEMIDNISFCRGVDVGIPIQRYTNLTAFSEYEIRIKAYDNMNVESESFSNVITWCAPPLCIKPGPCN